MKLSTELAAFSQRLGHDFTKNELLIEAMTHASFGSEGTRNNQRMEFLGDRVLGLVIADTLLTKYPDNDEGQLAPKFNALVRKEACADIAEELDLGAALKMGRSEMRAGGRRKEAILGDAMEAVIAAIYLDAGFERVQKIVLNHWDMLIKRAEKIETRDPKTRLQEWAQARGMPPPDYELISRDGPDHAPIFEIEAILKNGMRASAKATSKRAAQQGAASKILKELS